MSVTIKQIANDLNLAVSTVSKALRDSHEISPETKKKVFEYAEKLDYLPNPYASSLKRRKTGNIAVVLPEVADSFFYTAINGIESVARDKGYHVLVYLTHDDLKREESIIREFRSGRVDGILMSIVDSAGSNSHLLDLHASGIPLVFFDRVCDDIPTAQVLTDDFESGYRATAHLIKQGCRRIAFLSMSGNLLIINERLKGYEKAHREHNLEVESSSVICCTHNEDTNLSLIRQLLTSQKRPDGIVGSVEKVTTEAYSVCHELNLDIPQEIKIIGFAHLQIAHLLNPALSTIKQPAFEMGKTAAAILFRALEKPKSNYSKEVIVIPSLLIERLSSKGIY
jgi:LacI family transcriptional regulator